MTVVRFPLTLIEIIDDTGTEDHQIVDMRGEIDTKEMTDIKGMIDTRDGDHGLVPGLLTVMIENIEMSGNTSHSESDQLPRREMRRNLI